jgi:RHH-type rel operon transcriptional repressor/antitoxin RelB
MLAIRLPEELELRLENLAKKTGRTKTFYAREAIVEYIDDLEDYYLAEARSKSAVKNISMSEMKVRLGLDD